MKSFLERMGKREARSFIEVNGHLAAVGAAVCFVSVSIVAEACFQLFVATSNTYFPAVGAPEVAAVETLPARGRPAVVFSTEIGAGGRSGRLEISGACLCCGRMCAGLCCIAGAVNL